jgi:hypothetical protein
MVLFKRHLQTLTKNLKCPYYGLLDGADEEDAGSVPRNHWYPPTRLPEYMSPQCCEHLTSPRTWKHVDNMVAITFSMLFGLKGSGLSYIMVCCVLTGYSGY